MSTEFDVNLQPKDLFRFNMHQTYTTTQGPVSIILAVLVLVMAAVRYTQMEYGYAALYVGVAILFIVYIPVSLWQRAKLALKKNQVLANTLHYQVSEKGIQVVQGEDSGLLEWSMVYKLVATKQQILIYSNRVNAYIIPKEQLGDNYDTFKLIAENNLEKFRLKMK